MATLLLPEQIQEMDRIAIQEIGIPGLVLMEVAGRAVADAAETLHRSHGGPVLAVAGVGNNGGDAVVAARHLHNRGLDVQVVVAGKREKTSADMQSQLKMAENVEVPITFLYGEEGIAALKPLCAAHPILIEGIFGTGLCREVKGFLKDVIDVLDASAAHIVAVDVPSGIDAGTGQVLGTALKAEVTVTFQYAKLGHVIHPGREHTGELSVVDIGIPSNGLERVKPFCESVEDTVFDHAFPDRHPNSHKGTYGHLLVVAGVPQRPGAALLAGRSAMRVGTGLVTVGSTKETIARVCSAFDELMGIEVGTDALSAEAILHALETRTALAIGPSLEPDDALRSLLQEVLLGTRVPVVVDAGALAALGQDLSFLKQRRGDTILTPHPGEMSKLTGLNTHAIQQDRVGVARSLADATNAYVVLKGASTIVADPSGTVGIILSGNPGLASGGSGDVLTGVIGGLLAQGVSPGLATRAGAHLHGVAADLAAELQGEAGLVASDVIEALPDVVGEVESRTAGPGPEVASRG